MTCNNIYRNKNLHNNIIGKLYYINYINNSEIMLHIKIYI